jgi:serine/threonine protein kinase
VNDIASGSRPPTIEGFTNLRIIGRGGFSTVYAALQTDLHRNVAIKVITSDDESAHRLEREVRALGALADVPNIVTPHAVVVTGDGRPAMVMPLFGESLAQRITRYGPQPLDVVERWTRQLATCIDRSHSRRVFHRDIKPQNILLDDDGGAHIADFGIAGLDSLASRTATVQSVSPPHAPPERLRGDESDPESGDVYSLASTVYFALAGRAPFGSTSSGGALGLFERITNSPVPDDASIPSTIHAVLQQAMAKDATQRFDSAGEFADAMHDAAYGIDEETIKRPARLTTAPLGTVGPGRTATPSETVLRPTPSERKPHAAAPPQIPAPLPPFSVAAPAPQAGKRSEPARPAEMGPEPAGPGSTTSDNPDPGSAHRRRALVVAGALLGLLAVGLGVPTVIIASSGTPALALSINDETTDENPLPETFEVLVNGRVATADFVGSASSVTAIEAFEDTDAATVVLIVPERIAFDVDLDGPTRDDDGARTAEVIISDDEVTVAGWTDRSGEGANRSFDRPNPTAEAERAARAAESQARAEERRRISAEQIRVKDELFSIHDQLQAANAKHDGIWSGRDTAPYDEIAAVTNREVLPMVDSALSRLDGLTSGDPPAQAAIAAERACLVAHRDAFVREASFDPTLTDEENESQQTAAWNATTDPCADAVGKWAGLG